MISGKFGFAPAANNKRENLASGRSPSSPGSYREQASSHSMSTARCGGVNPPNSGACAFGFRLVLDVAIAVPAEGTDLFRGAVPNHHCIAGFSRQQDMQAPVDLTSHSLSPTVKLGARRFGASFSNTMLAMFIVTGVPD